MYEHPSLTYRLIESERAELERAAERRRFLREHSDQIVPGPPGPVRRLLRRLRGQHHCEPLRAEHAGDSLFKKMTGASA